MPRILSFVPKFDELLGFTVLLKLMNFLIEILKIRAQNPGVCIHFSNTLSFK
jgi:hypothetical protein